MATTQTAVDWSREWFAIEDATYLHTAAHGVAAVDHLLAWQPGDEVLTAKGEFPLQYATWRPMDERAGVKLRIVAPQDRFMTADDLIAAITPRTGVVSVSHVRSDDGALLVLDVSQSGGAVPMDVRDLGADLLVAAGRNHQRAPSAGTPQKRPRISISISRP